MKYIAGIDPGLVTGVAIVDVDSDYSETFSRKYFSFNDVCDFLISKGEPIIIATDVAAAPDAVKKIAANFGARLYIPRCDIRVDEKKEIAKGAGDNAHERDALAAALSAKKEFFRMFRKIDSALERKNLPEIKSEVKELLVKGEAGNTEQAVKMLTQKDEKKGTRVITRIMETKKIAGLKQEVERLSKAKHLLEEKVERLSAGIRNMQKPAASGSYKEMLSDRLAEENESLRKKIRELEHLIESGECEVLISGLSSGVEGKIILLEGDTDVKALEAMNPRAIVSSKRFDTSIPVIDAGKLPMQKIGRFTVARKKDIESILADRNNFLEWLEMYREERKRA